MTARSMDDLGVRRILRKRVSKAGSVESFANEHGLPPTYIADVIHGACHPGSKLLTALGLMKVSRYVRLRRAVMRRKQG